METERDEIYWICLWGAECVNCARSDLWGADAARCPPTRPPVRLPEKKTSFKYPLPKLIEALSKISCSQEDQSIYLLDYRSLISDVIDEAVGVNFKKIRLSLAQIKNIPREIPKYFPKMYDHSICDTPIYWGDCKQYTYRKSATIAVTWIAENVRHSNFLANAKETYLIAKPQCMLNTQKSDKTGYNKIL